ncbi:MAG: phospholipase D-like domain-containing protein [Methanomicrobiales archaeon]|nr:phospholipase D-like domain-containing protein [Methanomicrobiales archaeon]
MHRSGALLFFIVCILFISGQTCAILITEFCPDPYLPKDPDEFIVLGGEGLLAPVTIADGEGVLTFPPGARINGRVTLARDAQAFFLTHGTKPDYEWEDHDPGVPQVSVVGQFQLANQNEELILTVGGETAQHIRWPGDVEAREGQVHVLIGGKWDPRPFMIGQSRFSPETFENVTIEVFVSPDSSSDLVLETIKRAEREILVDVYEFTHPKIAEELLQAKRRGVTVTVLVEGGPVGGIPPDEVEVLNLLKSDGVPVFLMESQNESHAPYRYSHAKYLVIDREVLLLTTENFKQSGFPDQGMIGNRGWGVIIKDPGVSRYFTDVFFEDLNGPGVGPLSAVSPGGRSGEANPTSTYRARYPPATLSGARVTPVLAPDTSYLIATLIEGSSQSVDVEQAYITNPSTGDLNPYLAAAINASRRGVQVRVLLDSSWFNIEEEADNDEMVDLINRIAEEDNLPLEARCADLARSDLLKVHTKGVIVDRQRVLVSSINWNQNSPNFNREAGVILDHPGVGNYYTAVFEDDWAGGGDTAAYPGNEGMSSLLKWGAACVVILILVVIAIKRRG